MKRDAETVAHYRDPTGVLGGWRPVPEAVISR